MKRGEVLGNMAEFAKPPNSVFLSPEPASALFAVGLVAGAVVRGGGVCERKER